MLLAWLLTMGCADPAPDSADDSDVVWTPPPCPTDADATSGPPIAGGPTEVSGLAALADGLLAHDDSGSRPGLWRTGPDGVYPSHLEAEGAWVDPEDMELGPGPDGADAVWVGDVGNNARIRQTVTLWTWPMTEVLAGTLGEATRVVATWDGVSPDVESLLIDPLERTALLVAKAADDATVYEVPLEGGALAPVAAARLPDGTPLGLATAASMSPSRAWVAVRSYTQLLLWPKDPAAPVATAFEHEACPIPMVAQPQGESITFLDDTTLATWSEGAEEPVWTLRLR